MNRGVDHAAVFRGDRDRIDFIGLLGRGCREHGVEVHAWCLMSNHFHLLVRDSADSISELMRWVGTTYVRHYNDRHERDGPLFRGRFHSVPVRGHDYIQWLGRYIHLNPEALGSIQLPEYPWSSLPDYLGRRMTPTWVRTDHLLRYHGGCIEHFADFTLGAPRGLRLEPPSVDAAIAVVAEAHATRSGDSARAVRSAVATLLNPSAPTNSAERKARERALARRAADPAIGHIVDALEALVA